MLSVTIHVNKNAIEVYLRSLAAIQSELPEMESVLERDPVYFKAKYVDRRVPFHGEYHYMNYGVTINVPWEVYLMVVKLNSI
jgi:hypothetical protein